MLLRIGVLGGADELRIEEAESSLRPGQLIIIAFSIAMRLCWRREAGDRDDAVWMVAWTPEAASAQGTTKRAPQFHACSARVPRPGLSYR